MRNRFARCTLAMAFLAAGLFTFGGQPVSRVHAQTCSNTIRDSKQGIVGCVQLRAGLVIAHVKPNGAQDASNVGPAERPQAASVAQSGTAHLFPLSGPYPIHQSVYLWVQSVDVVHVADTNGLNNGAGNFRPKFRAYFDTGFCQYQTLDTLTEFAGFGGNDPGKDCTYALSASRGPFDDAHDGDPLVIALALPIQVAGQSPIPISISRYNGDQVRFRFDGTDEAPNPDNPQNALTFTSDKDLGGALAKFGPGSNFGAGGDPMTIAVGAYPFHLGALNGNTEPSDYSTQVGIYVSPAPVVPDRNLQVTGVMADRAFCQGGVESTFNVSVANPGQVTSEDYTLFMQRLDPQTNKLIGTPGYSQVQQGVAAIDSAVGIATNITLPPGEHHLAVWAHASGTNPGDMATAAEFTINCGPDPGGMLSLIPAATPASVDQSAHPIVNVPQPTLVPPTSRPSGTVVATTTVLLPTATPTPTSTPIGSVFHPTGILLPTATAASGRRLP
jgi:hypothetical protein